MSSVHTPHKSDKPYTASTAPSIVFSGNKSCILSPETTEGPFCKSFIFLSVYNLLNLQLNYADVIGESIRTNLVDGQLGVPLHLDIQVIDVNTCQPLNKTFLEMWSK